MSLFKILSIDGGGIRGILPAQLLAAIEAKLQQKSGNSQARIADYVNLVAGTSTGGIITTLLLTPNEQGRPKYAATEITQFYKQYGRQIFADSFWRKLYTLNGLFGPNYSAKAFETILKDFLGDKTNADMLRPFIVTAFETARAESVFFSNRMKQKATTVQRERAIEPFWKFYMRDIVRSTAAAPTYLPPACISPIENPSYKYSLIDGGVFANNPAMCAVIEAMKTPFAANDNAQAPKPNQLVLISLGTSSSPVGHDYSKVKDWGKIKWIKPVLNSMMVGSADTVDYQCRKLFEAHGLKENYI
ncbi:MAG TPA: patatin-like phospholipase family protein, partial [Chitinophagales bacterium]|nr:patatin-like phospholipase family protein [Chitinophagales bacterium]